MKDDASLAAKLMAQLGGQPAPKKDATPLSDDLDNQTPLRITEFKRDKLGRLKNRNRVRVYYTHPTNLSNNQNISN